MPAALVYVKEVRQHLALKKKTNEELGSISDCLREAIRVAVCFHLLIGYRIQREEDMRERERERDEKKKMHQLTSYKVNEALNGWLDCNYLMMSPVYVSFFFPFSLSFVFCCTLAYGSCLTGV